MAMIQFGCGCIALEFDDRHVILIEDCRESFGEPMFAMVETTVFRDHDIHAEVAFPEAADRIAKIGLAVGNGNTLQEIRRLLK